MMQHGEYRQEPEGKNASYSVSEKKNLKTGRPFQVKIGTLKVSIRPRMLILIRDSVILFPVEISFRILDQNFF